jgi:ketosteroid isomerase-like protein
VSQENVELVRLWIALTHEWRADPGDDDANIDRAFRDYLDEGFKFELAPGYPEDVSAFKGRDGWLRYVAWIRDSWSEYRFEPERFIDAGDRVVVGGHVVARGRGSGVQVERTLTLVVTLRGGLIFRFRFYPDHAEALTAVGLEE